MYIGGSVAATKHHMCCASPNIKCALQDVWQSPNRTMLGEEQLAWLQSKIETYTPRSTWQIYASTTVMGKQVGAAARGRRAAAPGPPVDRCMRHATYLLFMQPNCMAHAKGLPAAGVFDACKQPYIMQYKERIRNGFLVGLLKARVSVGRLVGGSYSGGAASSGVLEARRPAER
eukprot:365845-Chlamydomonas_euryale.AAC.4